MKGFTKLENNLLFSKELGVYTKLVLMGLNYFTRNGTGECFCKKTTLASYLNLSLYQVRQGLVELEELEVINIKRVGQGNPDIITINDLKSTSEKISTTNHYREEKEEEEEVITKTPDGVEQKTTTELPQVSPKTPTPQSTDQTDVVTCDIPDEVSEETKTLQGGLQEVLRPTTYQTWFSKCRVVSVDQDKTIIGFPYPTWQLEWVKDNYLDLLTRVSNSSVTIVKLEEGLYG